MMWQFSSTPISKGGGCWTGTGKAKTDGSWIGGARDTILLPPEDEAPPPGQARSYYCSWGYELADAVWPERAPAVEYTGQKSGPNDVLVGGRCESSPCTQLACLQHDAGPL